MIKRTREKRSDAVRNLDALTASATAVFAEAGVDAPVRLIAARAGVGVGTVYRHFPTRADLVAAVFRREIDACVEAATTLASASEPQEALAAWLQRYAALIETKRGLAAALHSGNPAYASLPAYFEERLVAPLEGLLSSAVRAGSVRDDFTPLELLHMVRSLCMPAAGDDEGRARRMVALIMDGLRFRATR